MEEVKLKREAYKREYDKIQEEAWKEYKKISDKAFSKFLKIVKPALKEYNKWVNYPIKYVIWNPDKEKEINKVLDKCWKIKLEVLGYYTDSLSDKVDIIRKFNVWLFKEVFGEEK